MRPIKSLDLDKITLPFKYITGPLCAIGAVVMSLFLYVYQTDRQTYKEDRQTTKEDFAEIKTSQRELIVKMDKRQESDLAYRERVEDRFNYVYKQCCAN